MQLKRTFTEILDTSKHQVFLLSCPATAPFSFSQHAWFVVNRRGLISRWEVFLTRNRAERNLGHLYLNTLPPGYGIPIIPFLKLYWSATLHWHSDGTDEATVMRMVEFIEQSHETYPHRDRYSLPGPNCNTYVQWVLDHFPEVAVRLPATCIGKRYQSRG